MEGDTLTGSQMDTSYFLLLCLNLCTGPVLGLLYHWSPELRRCPGRVSAGHRRRSQGEGEINSTDIPASSSLSAQRISPSYSPDFPLSTPGSLSACLLCLIHLYWSLLMFSFLSIPYNPNCYSSGTECNLYKWWWCYSFAQWLPNTPSWSAASHKGCSPSSQAWLPWPLSPTQYARLCPAPEPPLPWDALPLTCG